MHAGRRLEFAFQLGRHGLQFLDLAMLVSHSLEAHLEHWVCAPSHGACFGNLLAQACHLTRLLSQSIDNRVVHETAKAAAQT